MFARWQMLLVSAVTAVGGAVGCLNPQTTRLPTIAGADERLDPRDQQKIERRDLERHDPFPSNSAGPQTFTRPQGHIEQRSDIRRTREESLLRGMNRNSVSPPSSSIQNPYPDTVRE